MGKKTDKSLKSFIKEVDKKEGGKYSELSKGLSELDNMMKSNPSLETAKKEKPKKKVDIFPKLKGIEKKEHTMKLKHENKKKISVKGLNMEELLSLEEDLNEEDASHEEFERVWAAMGQITGKDPTGQTYGTFNGDDYDYTYKGRTIRFSFTKNLRENLIQENMSANSGKLICVVCGNEIVLEDGKEVWISKNKKEHRTAPPIDHHNPAWSKRLSDLEKKKLPIDKMMEQGKLLYNARPLRILHMRCNSSIGDRH